MAEIWGAALAAGAAIYGASAQKSAASKSARASQNATNASIGEQQREYDQNRTDQQPWLQAGQYALGQQQKLLGGDYSGFTTSPDYQFALSQGLQGLDRTAAARGGLLSGGHSADVVNYAQGLASQNYNNYFSKLQGLSGSGQNSAQNLGYAGQNMANQYSGLQTNNANNMASSYGNIGNTNAQLGGALAGAFNKGYQQYNQPPPVSTAYQPYTGAYAPGFDNSWGIGTAGRGPNG